MKTAEILLGFGSSDTRERISYLLRQNSYIAMEISARGADLIRSLLASPPSLLLADFGFFGPNNLENLRIITEDAICPVALVTDDRERELLSPELEASEYLFIIQRPINKAAFINNIEFILRSAGKLNLLRKEMIDLKQILETRKLADRAKSELMKSTGMSEEAAHRQLQKLSMETRRPLKEIALEIISKHSD